MSKLIIKVEGFPEMVQRVADVLDAAFPGVVAWTRSEGNESDEIEEFVIKIEGQWLV